MLWNIYSRPLYRETDGKEGEKPEANMKVSSSSFGTIGGSSARVGEYVGRRRVVGGFI